MRKSTRAAQTELLQIEEQFRMRLLEALSKCANGAWGLFSQNPPSRFGHGTEPDEAVLSELGTRIAVLRSKVGAEPNVLYERYLFYRAIRGPHALSEPRLAQKFLEELGLDDDQPRAR